MAWHLTSRRSPGAGVRAYEMNIRPPATAGVLGIRSPRSNLARAVLFRCGQHDHLSLAGNAVAIRDADPPRLEGVRPAAGASGPSPIGASRHVTIPWSFHKKTSGSLAIGVTT